MNIIEYINLEDPEHIKAIKFWFNEGVWPVDFIPNDVKFSSMWQSSLMHILAQEFLKLK